MADQTAELIDKAQALISDMEELLGLAYEWLDDLRHERGITTTTPIPEWGESSQT